MFCTVVYFILKLCAEKDSLQSLYIFAGLEESIVRGYTVKRDRGARQGIQVGELAATPKSASAPFSGSQLTFRLTDDGSAPLQAL